MSPEEFCEILKDNLNEATDIKVDTDFKNLESYGSLSAVLILQLVEDHFGVKLNPREFRKMNTVNDILNAVSVS